MKAENLINEYPPEEEIDAFQSVNRLIAINAMFEAAKMGKEGKKFAHLTQEMMSLARDAAADDERMLSMVEKQIQSIHDMKSSAD